MVNTIKVHKRLDCENCPFDFPMSYQYKRWYCQYECGVELSPIKTEVKNEDPEYNEFN